MDQPDAAIEQLITKLLAVADAADPVPAAQEAECREIGQFLYDLGGLDAMRAASEYVKERRPLAGLLLEWMWDGVGEWKRS